MTREGSPLGRKARTYPQPERREGVGTRWVERRGEPVHVARVLAGLLGAEALEPPSERREKSAAGTQGRRQVLSKRPVGASRSAVFDFDLAEFPLFRYEPGVRARKRFEPLVYRDVITARDGSRVCREWRATPGPAGVGGPSAQSLLFDLIQLYVEQGGTGGCISYLSMRSLLRRRGLIHPSRRDFERLRSDLEVLRGYEIRCENASWNLETRRYVDSTWSLFEPGTHFARSGERPASRELVIGETWELLASARGFLNLGFDAALFHQLKPLEQRLALYLARKLRYQVVHRRYVEDLARALPIEAGRPWDVRRTLRRTSEGLLARGIRFLAGCRFTRKRGGRWVAEYRSVLGTGRALSSETIETQVDRIVEATGNARDRAWWTRCVRRLGPGPLDRALGQLREACDSGGVRNRAALLTVILKDIAMENGISLA